MSTKCPVTSLTCTFHPGQVLAFKKTGLLGLGVSLAEGGAQDTHVAIVLPNGKLGSTGAILGLWYGEVDPYKYCKGRSFDILRPIEPYTQAQLDTLQDCHQEVMKHFWPRLYGTFRYPQLYLSSIFGKGDVAAVQDPAPDPPKYFICSWIVGYFLWKMGIPVGKMFGKINYTGLAPSDFEREADAVDDMISQATEGGVYPFRGNCQYLHRTMQVVNYGGF